MANWQHIDELHDISADLPRFTLAFRELSTRLGLQISALEADHISLRCHHNKRPIKSKVGCRGATA
ncbi:hypothetical protein A9Y87_10695 [Salmonella enterica subsp. enterica]|nr:hypothetical protein A9Y87_10695 [Salmonella enterica subsp. enterica]